MSLSPLVSFSCITTLSSSLSSSLPSYYLYSLLCIHLYSSLSFVLCPILTFLISFLVLYFYPYPLDISSYMFRGALIFLTTKFLSPQVRKFCNNSPSLCILMKSSAPPLLSLETPTITLGTVDLPVNSPKYS